MRKSLWVPAFAGMTLISILAATAWAIVAAPGDVVPLRLQITSAGAGITGLKPKLTIIRQDGTVFRAATTMVPADGQAGVYGGSFTCPAGAAHYTAYENNTGMYADSETEPIDVEPAASGGQAYVNVTGINSYLASQHGSGNWGALGMSMLPFQGAVSYAGPAATGSTIRMKQGDTPTFTVQVTQSGADFNLTGWTADFAAKAHPTDTVYAIAVRAATITDAVHGQVSVTLASSDTSSLAPGLYYAALKLYNGTQVITAWTCNLYIDPAIIQ